MHGSHRLEITELPPTQLDLPRRGPVGIATQRWALEPWEGEDPPELGPTWSRKGKFSVNESRSCAELGPRQLSRSPEREAGADLLVHCHRSGRREPSLAATRSLADYAPWLWIIATAVASSTSSAMLPLAPARAAASRRLARLAT